MSRFGFSIITCTHQPNYLEFERLVQSIVNLQKSEVNFEWIIVDNNSVPPIETNHSYTQLFSSIKNVRIVSEKKLGLTAARLAGIASSIHEYLVFFDDDNEPSFDYLLNAEKLIVNNPSVACWGAGRIQVNYLAKKYDPWFDHKKVIFQERDVRETLLFQDSHWQKGYPQGTGLICRKDVLLKYAELVAAGKLSLTDRKGRSLASGGDVQIVLLAVKSGYQVGISGSLQLQHNIDDRKANFKYVIRLQYGTSSSYVQAFNQVQDQSKISFKKITNAGILIILMNHIRFFKTRFLSKDGLLRLTKQLGEANAMYVAYPVEQPPYLLRKISNLIS